VRQAPKKEKRHSSDFKHVSAVYLCIDLILTWMAGTNEGFQRKSYFVWVLLYFFPPPSLCFVAVRRLVIRQDFIYSAVYSRVARGLGL